MTWRAAPLFDHLIGALLQKERHVQAEGLGGLDVDDKLELDRGLDRKIGRLFSAQDAVNIGRRAPEIIGLIRSVGQQAAEFNEETIRIDGRQTVASSQRCDLRAMNERKASGITIKPLFGSRVVAAMMDSSLDVS